MYDYHVHTDFSGDCMEPMEKSVLSAIEKNGKEICFTDHLDYDYPTTEVVFEFDHIGFEESLGKLQKKYEDKIRILKGIEIGIQPHLAKECDDFITMYKPDFVLCSFHVADRKDLYNGDFYANKSPIEAWKAYFEDVKKSLTAFKNYSVVGHLDIPKRYDAKVKAVNFNEYKHLVADVLKIIIEDGKGIEINMSGLRSDLNETLPNRSILEMYYDLGGKYITLGSDAHNQADIYSHNHDVLRMLEEIGFEHITTYENMKPKQIKIRDAF